MTKESTLLVQNPIYSIHSIFIRRPYEDVECSWVFHSIFSQCYEQRLYDPQPCFISLFHRKTSYELNEKLQPMKTLRNRALGISPMKLMILVQFKSPFYKHRQGRSQPIVLGLYIFIVIIYYNKNRELTRNTSRKYTIKNLTCRDLK